MGFETPERENENKERIERLAIELDEIALKYGMFHMAKAIRLMSANTRDTLKNAVEAADRSIKAKEAAEKRV